MGLVVAVGQVLSHLHQLEGYNFETTGLQAGYDITHQAALDTVRLYQE